MARGPQKPDLTKGKLAIDHDLIRELAKLLEETGLTEIEIERDGMRVRAGRAESSKAQNPPAAAAAHASSEHGPFRSRKASRHRQLPHGRDRLSFP